MLASFDSGEKVEDYAKAEGIIIPVEAETEK